MRFVLTFAVMLCIVPVIWAQNVDNLAGWFVDDFDATTFKPQWEEVSGTWGLDGSGASMKVTSQPAMLMNSTYVMRTKSYVLETVVQGGGGLMFCMEHPKVKANGHLVYFTGSRIRIGYLDHNSEFVETRALDYIMPTTKVKLRIDIDPKNRRFSVFVQENDIALEELRFRSGYFGLYSEKSDVVFDYCQLLGEGLLDTPSYFVRSNKTQIDNISYMTTVDDALMISNPVVGIVQRITGTGNYVNESPVQGPRAEPRGIFVNEKKWMYLVDGGQNQVRIINDKWQLELVIGENLVDPRGVVADASGSQIMVLDAEGIKVFDQKGNLTAVKAQGKFKDPKNIWAAKGLVYVADYGNGQVIILDGKTLDMKDLLKGDLVKPWDVFVDPVDGHIYVADPGAGAVFHFDQNKELVEKFDPITIRGFISPRAVRVNNKMIYIADMERILVFKQGVLAIRPNFTIEMKD